MKFKFKTIADVLTILFALFLLVFSFDVFMTDEPLIEQIIGFLIHNAPVYLIIVIFVVARKNTMTASVICMVVFFMFTLFFRTYQDIIVFLMISFPLVVIGILYYLDYRKKEF